MDVEVENTNENPGDIFPLTFALHTYFNVPDVEKCRIDGGFKGNFIFIKVHTVGYKRLKLDKKSN